MGYHFISSEEGELASGATGSGRLAGLDRIQHGVKRALFGNDRLKGKKILITAGPTRESLDPVRYLSNRSSGKMGYALAEEAVLRGAEVTLISGPVALHLIENTSNINVETACNSLDEVLENQSITKNNILPSITTVM